MNVMEMSYDACKIICNNFHRRNRCVYVTGTSPSSPDLMKSSYYCIPADFMTSVYEFVPQESTSTKTVRLQSGDVTQMSPATSFEILQNKKEAVITLTKNDQDSQHFLSLVTRFSPTLATIFRTNYRKQPRARCCIFQTIDNFFVFPAENFDVYIHTLVQGTYQQTGESKQTICKHIFFSSSFDDSMDFLYDKKESECPDKWKLLFMPNYLRICETLSCQHIIMLPYDKNSPLRRLEISKANTGLKIIETDSPYLIEMESLRNQLENLVSTGPSEALYQTVDGSTLNKRRISQFSRDIFKDNTIDLFFCGGQNTAMSWLHVARSLMSSRSGGQLSDVTYIERSERLKVVVDCDIDNCIGCNTNPPPPDNRYAELQARCFAAQECAVQKCVGTQINMRKPLCNLGKLAKTVLDVYRLSAQGMWIAFTRTVIILVEISENRKQVYQLDWFDEIFMSNVCQAKDAILKRQLP